MNKLSNVIITPYALYQEICNRRYNKAVYPDKYCESDRWYYFTKTGILRTVMYKDNSIWTASNGDGNFITRIR